MAKRKDANRKKSEIAIEAVMAYLGERRYKCRDVSDQHIGYDVSARKGRKKLKIEVKGCENEGGVPDCYPSEFDSKLKIKADYFYLVRMIRDMPYAIDVVSRKEFNQYADKHKIVKRVRVASALKTALKNQKVGERVKLENRLGL